jgi:hypothetical protein
VNGEDAAPPAAGHGLDSRARNELVELLALSLVTPSPPFAKGQDVFAFACIMTAVIAVGGPLVPLFRVT